MDDGSWLFPRGADRQRMREMDRALRPVRQRAFAVLTVALLAPRVATTAWLALPLVTLGGRFSERGIAVGVAYAVALLLAVSFGVNMQAVLDNPPLVIAPLALMVAIGMFQTVLMRSDVKYRSQAILDPLAGVLNRMALGRASRDRRRADRGRPRDHEPRRRRVRSRMPPDARSYGASEAGRRVKTSQETSRATSMPLMKATTWRPVISSTIARNFSSVAYWNIMRMSRRRCPSPMSRIVRSTGVRVLPSSVMSVSGPAKRELTVSGPRPNCTL
jgi:hypothetical protein